MIQNSYVEAMCMWQQGINGLVLKKQNLTHSRKPMQGLEGSDTIIPYRAFGFFEGRVVIKSIINN